MTQTDPGSSFQINKIKWLFLVIIRRSLAAIATAARQNRCNPDEDVQCVHVDVNGPENIKNTKRVLFSLRIS